MKLCLHDLQANRRNPAVARFDDPAAPILARSLEPSSRHSLDRSERCWAVMASGFRQGPFVGDEQERLGHRQLSAARQHCSESKSLAYRLDLGIQGRKI